MASLAAVRDGRAAFGGAGAVLYLFLRLRGNPRPSPRNWGAAFLVGGLLLGVGNGARLLVRAMGPLGPGRSHSRHRAALDDGAALAGRARAARRIRRRWPAWRWASAGVATLVGGVGARGGGRRRRTVGGRDRPPGGQSLLGRRLPLVPDGCRCRKRRRWRRAMEMLAASPLMAVTALGPRRMGAVSSGRGHAGPLAGARLSGRVRKPGRLRLVRLPVEAHQSPPGPRPTPS